MTTTATLSRLATAIFGLAALVSSAPGQAQVQPAASTESVVSERLTVADPFLEMPTAPARGYPVFIVV